MVLKKRHSIYVEEDGPKKRRKEEVREEPKDIKKKSKKGKEIPAKVEKRLSEDEYEEDDPEEEENDEVEDVNEDPEDPGRDENEEYDEIGWPKDDLIELFNKIEATLPRNDVLLHTTQAERLDWEQVAFNEYSPSECRRVWTEIHKKIRHFRILKEIIDDARIWVHQPWTNFYKSKTVKHPDMPRRPPSSYLLYFKAKRDKVAAQRPDLDMTRISSIVAQMYHGLSESKKAKYIKMAEDLRKEYEEKRRIFLEQHPNYEQDTKLVKLATNKRVPKNLPAGLPKPRPAKQIFIDDREEKLKDEPNFDKTEVRNLAKQQWESLSEKKRLVWINWAVEEENKYLEKMKLYKADNPEFELPKMKTVLNKKELLLRDRAVGKPPKPPNSGYSLYSKVMLAKCADLRPLLPKDRMKEISVRWNKLSVEEQEEYKNKVKYEQEQYKLNYATYLESLSEEERKEELLKSQKVISSKRKVVEEVNNGRNAKSKSNKSNKKRGKSVKKFERQYFPGEPHQPPVNAYDLFVASFVSDTKLSASEAPRFWDMLPTNDKGKFTKKLKELKEKYIRDYKKFLKSLDEDEVAKYNDLQKRNKEREAAAEAEQKAQRSDDDSDQASSSEDEIDEAVNNKKNKSNGSDSDENNETENKKSDSSSDSSSSSSESSSGSSSSDDSDSSSDESDDDDKNTTQVTVKKEDSDSDSSDD